MKQDGSKRMEDQVLRCRNYDLVTDRHGTRLRAKGPWSADMRQRIEKDQITRLELNQSWGWAGETLDFLWEVPGLTRLHLLDSRIEDVAGVYHLSDLEDLTLDARSFKTEIDLTRFAKLHRLVLEWRERVINLSACRNLKSLGLWSYQFPDCGELSGLTNLERLTLSESPVRSLAG